MNIIARPRYLKRIRPYIGTKIIKAVVGQRRVGKSYVLLQIAELLRAEHPDWLILYIDLERLEWRHLRTGDDLVREVSMAISSGDKTGAHTSQAKIALLLDEVQELQGYETAVRGFAADERFDVYISVRTPMCSLAISRRFLREGWFGLRYIPSHMTNF